MNAYVRGGPILLLAATLLPACARVSVDPIEVKPIHIVHDINIRVDKQLDEFFAFQEKAAAAATQPATTQSVPPATADVRQGASS